jgi:hypothetical protein
VLNIEGCRKVGKIAIRVQTQPAHKKESETISNNQLTGVFVNYNRVFGMNKVGF